MLLVKARLPEPVVDHPVLVRPGLVLHADLAYPDLRVVFEYEGDGHRTSRRQWLRDIERRELFESAGERVVRVTSIDLFESSEAFVQRVRRIRAVRRAESSMLRPSTTKRHHS
jgi:very-short-patch-repair endonuclease